MYTLIKYRIESSIFTLPSVDDLVWTIGLLIIFALISIPLGYKVNVLEFKIPEISREILIQILLKTLIFPAAAEELFFRVLFLPHELEKSTISTQLFWAVVSLILFVIYHPLNGMIFLRNAKELFVNSSFLILVSILGVICTISYIQSGTIYTPILIHWITVIFWLFLFGGYQKLYL